MAARDSMQFKKIGAINCETGYYDVAGVLADGSVHHRRSDQNSWASLSNDQGKPKQGDRFIDIIDIAGIFLRSDDNYIYGYCAVGADQNIYQAYWDERKRMTGRLS